MTQTHVSYKDVESKILAAKALLIESTTTVEKIQHIKTLLRGIHTDIDARLAELDKHLSTFGNLAQGDVISLSADGLPEETEEQKKRKKFILLFIKYWNDLKSEVARVQSEMQSQQSGSQTSMWARIFSATKGPLAVITIVAIGIAALAATSVNIEIKNSGCGTLYAGHVPVSIPGLALPSAPIPSGGSAIATIPPLSLTIDGSKQGTLTLSSLKLNFSIQLSNSVRDVTFDDISLLGTTTVVQLGTKKLHTLELNCR